MRRAFRIALSAWFAIAMTIAQVGLAAAQSSGPAGYASPSAASIDTRGYTANPDKSRALTEYLKQHRLPLVGAQVLEGPGGKRVVVLYGFVATDFGKADARSKAQSFLGNSTLTVENRIMVNPELQMAGRSTNQPSTPAAKRESQSTAAAQAQASNAMPGVQSYVDQQNQDAAAQAGQFSPLQGSIGGVSTMLPLVALLGILGMGMISRGNGFSMGSSPYGSAPYGGSPYGYSPYGNPPYGNPPYGGSPYGGSPYGGGPGYPSNFGPSPYTPFP
ncbi:MAG: hypothetical protein IVW56_02190 [Candidatus Binataceae bacterium]|nr:hypothetical protein [Candidatus Binataceae bacterium]